MYIIPTWRPNEGESFAAFWNAGSISTPMVHQQTIRLLVEYCIVLQRQKQWPGLLVAIHHAYQAISAMGSSLPKRFCSEQILLVKPALISIPRPLGQHVSLDMVEEILHLDCILFENVTTPPRRSLGWVEEGEIMVGDVENESESVTDSSLVELEDMVEADEGSVMEVDSNMDNASSNKFGMTYTESASGLTDISFNLSDLWK
ncbi:hypothetical protein BDZ45DRAFT_403554 [Acephala macrosclerotiorum]|nr:hypothetical protein BDZ45DRAFT_403554 [Acephala macrosclerotiorum]